MKEERKVLMQPISRMRREDGTLTLGNLELLHGGDYNPEQWLDRPDILKEDIRMMKKAKVNVVTLGVFSWSVLEPEEGNYQFDWLSDIMDRLYENGIYIILATPSGAKPIWIDEKYPEVLRVDEWGRRRHHGVRHNHCITSPVYRKKVEEMDTRLAEHFGKHPGLLLWHISNELGGSCWCSLCQKKFQDYLEKKFNGDIDALNKAWWTTFWSHRYQRFNQIEPPFANGEGSIMGLNLEWKRFTTWNMTDYMKTEIAVLKRITPEIPVTTNFMKLYPGLDYRVLAKELDLISWDSYPRYHNDYESLYDTCMENSFDHAVMRSMKKGCPFLLMESVPGAVNWHEFNKVKRPGMHKLAAIQTIACGSDSVQYFQWRKSRGSFEQYHGAVVDHLGRDDTRIFQEVEETGTILEKLKSVTGSVVKAEAAVLFDWDNRWAIEDMKGLSQKKKLYEKTCMSLYRLLAELGVEADIISRKDRLEEYKAVFAPMLYLIEEETGERIKAYVNQGGQFLATYFTGYVDQNTLCYLGGFPGAGLKELFGVYSEEIDSLYPSDRNYVKFCDGTCGEVRDFAELLKVVDAQVLGAYTDDFYAGEAAVTKKHISKSCTNGGKAPGGAWYVGARLDDRTMKGLLCQVCNEAGIRICPLPLEVEHHCREDEAYRYHFWMNYGEKKAVLSGLSGKNMITDQNVHGTVEIDSMDILVLQEKTSADYEKRGKPVC